MSDGVSDRSEQQDEVAGPTMANILLLPDAERQVVNWLARQGETRLADLVTRLGRSAEDLNAALDALHARGFVHGHRDEAGWRYRTRIVPKPPRRLPDRLWKVIEDEPAH